MPVTSGECKNGATSKRMSDYVEDIKNIVDYYNENFYEIAPDQTSVVQLSLPIHLAVYEELSGTYPVCMLAGTNRVILFGIKGAYIDNLENGCGKLGALYFRSKNASCRCFGININPCNGMDVDEAFSVAFGNADKSVHLRAGGSNVGSINVAKNAFRQYTFYYANESESCDCLIDLYKTGNGYYQSGTSSDSGDWIIGALPVKFNPSISNASALSSLQYSPKAWGNTQWLQNIKAAQSKCVDDEWLAYESGGGTGDPFVFSGNIISLGDFVYTTYPRLEDLSVINGALFDAHLITKALLLQKRPYTSNYSYQDIREGNFKYSYIEDVEVGEIGIGIRINFAPVENFPQTTCICGLIGYGGFVLNELKACNSIVDAIQKLSIDESEFCAWDRYITMEECGNPSSVAAYAMRMSEYVACFNESQVFSRFIQNAASFSCDGLKQFIMRDRNSAEMQYTNQCCFQPDFVGQGPGYCIPMYTFSGSVEVSAYLGLTVDLPFDPFYECKPATLTISGSVGGVSIAPVTLQGSCGDYRSAHIQINGKDGDIINIDAQSSGFVRDYRVVATGYGCEGSYSFRAIICDEHIECSTNCPNSPFDPNCGKYCVQMNVPQLHYNYNIGESFYATVKTDTLTVGNTTIVQSKCLCE